MASAAAAVGAAVVAEAIGEGLGAAEGGGDGMGSWGIAAAAAAAEVHTGSAIVGMMECSALAERLEDYDILVLPLLLR